MVKPMTETTQGRWPMIMGFLASIGATLCCVMPLLLLTLGISGAWIGKLQMFVPYQPYFIGVVVLLFAYAGYKIHLPVDKCNVGLSCALPLVRKRRISIFWIVLFLASIIISSNYWIVWLMS